MHIDFSALAIRQDDYRRICVQLDDMLGAAPRTIVLDFVPEGIVKPFLSKQSDSFWMLGSLPISPAIPSWHDFLAPGRRYVVQPPPNYFFSSTVAPFTLTSSSVICTFDHPACSQRAKSPTPIDIHDD